MPKKTPKNQDDPLVHRIPRLDKQRKDAVQRTNPRHAPQHRQPRIVLQHDIAEIVRRPRCQVPERQPVEVAEPDVRDVGGHDAGGEERQRLEAVGRRRARPLDALQRRLGDARVLEGVFFGGAGAKGGVSLVVGARGEAAAGGGGVTWPGRSCGQRGRLRRRGGP